MAGNQGFADMDEQQQKDISSLGGQSQGAENNPANFANDRDKARRAGQNSGNNQDDMMDEAA